VLRPSTDLAFACFLEGRAVDRFAQVESGCAELVENRAYRREQAAPLRQDDDTGAADHGQAALGRGAPTDAVVDQNHDRVGGLQRQRDRLGLPGVEITREPVVGGRAERRLFPGSRTRSRPPGLPAGRRRR
jgi:hypothetical protein